MMGPVICGTYIQQNCIKVCSQNSMNAFSRYKFCNMLVSTARFHLCIKHLQKEIFPCLAGLQNILYGIRIIIRLFPIPHDTISASLTTGTSRYAERLDLQDPSRCQDNIPIWRSFPPCHAREEYLISRKHRHQVGRSDRGPRTKSERKRPIVAV